MEIILKDKSLKKKLGDDNDNDGKKMSRNGEESAWPGALRGKDHLCGQSQQELMNKIFRKV